MDLLRHCDLDDLSRTAVESKSNRSCNDHITTVLRFDGNAIRLLIKGH